MLLHNRSRAILRHMIVSGNCFLPNQQVLRKYSYIIGKMYSWAGFGPRAVVCKPLLYSVSAVCAL